MMENFNNNDSSSNKSELFAAWSGTFACAFACFAALPLGMKAGWELDLTPAALGCVLAGAWSLGIAAGGYASLFWKRMHTRLGRAMLLVLASFAAAGMCSTIDGGVFLTLLGVVGMIGAGLFAAQFRPGPSVSTVVTSTVWALTGAVAALLLMPPLYALLEQMSLGATGAWRVAMMAAPVTLVIASAVGYRLTRPTAESTLETGPAEFTEPMPTEMAAAA